MLLDVSTTRDGNRAKFGGGAAVSHSWRSARITFHVLGQPALALHALDCREDAPALGLLLVQPLELGVDQAVSMNRPTGACRLSGSPWRARHCHRRQRTGTHRGRGQGARGRDGPDRRRWRAVEGAWTSCRWSVKRTRRRTSPGHAGARAIETLYTWRGRLTNDKSRVSEGCRNGDQEAKCKE